MRNSYVTGTVISTAPLLPTAQSMYVGCPAIRLPVVCVPVTSEGTTGLDHPLGVYGVRLTWLTKVIQVPVKVKLLSFSLLSAMVLSGSATMVMLCWPAGSV